MVGDRVTIEHEHSRRHGVISQIEDTSRLHTVRTNASDDQFRSFTYHIRLDNSQVQVTKYKASEIQRDRSFFSKLILKQFLRSTVTRESWNGAPWRVKDHLALKYNIPRTVPEAKTRDAIMAAKKAENAARLQALQQNAQAAAMATAANGAPQTHRGVNGRTHGNGHAFVNYSANAHHPPFRQDGTPPLPPFHDPQRPPQPYPQQMNGTQGPSPSPGPGQQPLPPIYQAVPVQALPPHLQYLFHQPQLSLPQGAPGGPALPVNPPFHNNFMQYQTLAPTTSSPSQTPSLPPQRLYEPVKYPTEDLRIREPKTATVRPPLKFISDDVPEGVKAPDEDDKTGIQMKSVGKILCAWDTLNVHDTIYHLDSFTLDDFVDAMRYSSEEVECELLTEVHCAVMKQIMNTSGKYLVHLPHANNEEEEEEEEEGSEEESSPEPEPEPPVRTTRSSLRKSEANALAKQRTPTPEPPKQLHKAAEFLAEYNWTEKLKIRDFREGGWQAILVGLLYRLSFSPVNKEACDEILAVLVPPEDEPSVETVAYNYVYMDINLRITALEMILLLTISTEAFRDQLLSASADMTKLRKEKIEHQRRRKEL